MNNNLLYLLIVLAKRNGGTLEINETDFQMYGDVLGQKLVIYENPEFSKVILEVVEENEND